MAKLDWLWIFEENPKACYELYKWSSANVREYKYFTYEMFLDVLIRNGFVDVSEKIFDFFDKVYIQCYVIPISLRYFSGCAMSEHKMIKCHDYISRRDAVKEVVCNAFELLEERIRYM